MDIGSLLLVLSLLLLVALFVSRPFIEGKRFRSSTVDEEEHEVSALMAERDRVINALRELDFDHAVGKIAEEDYPLQRLALLEKGAGILRALDSHAETYPELAPAEDRIEAAVAARRAHLAPAYNGNGGSNTIEAAEDDLEVAIALRKRERKEKTAGFCPHCGKPVQALDKFCPRCGKAL